MNLKLSLYSISDIVLVNMSEVAVNFSNSTNTLGKKVTKKKRLK